MSTFIIYEYKTDGTFKPPYAMKFLTTCGCEIGEQRDFTGLLGESFTSYDDVWAILGERIC